MKIVSTIVLLFSSLGLLAQSPFIHVDQFGYTPNAKKVAVLSDPHLGFNSNLSYTANAIELRDATSNNVISTYTPEEWNGGSIDTDWSGDKGWWVDFSDIITPGSYYLHDPIANESSAEFEISYDVYDVALEAASKMFYYNRCNMDKATPYAESNWTDGNNFENALQDANCRYIYDPNNAALEKDLTGGWFDAGDYNKYTTFTLETIHNLLWAYRLNPSAFTDNFNIPESGNGIPDILDEVIYELDWLKKMCNPDGTVHIKMGSKNYSENVSSPPSANVDPRYYGPTCTSASLTVASVFAHAHTVLKDFSPLVSYADGLLVQAEDCWDYVKPFYDNGTLELDCDDGSIVAGDADFDADDYQEVFIATAIYLFEATGNSTYNTFITNEYQKSSVFGNDFNDPNDDWWDVNHVTARDAFLNYATVTGRDQTVADDLTNSFSNAVNNNWGSFFGASTIDLYRAYMPDYFLGWGSNSLQGDMGNINLAVNNYLSGNNNPDSYIEKAAGHIQYLNGCNPLGKVYLSNMYGKGAERCADEIYHTWFADGTDYDNAITSLYGPAPGFLSGGPNHYYGGTLDPPAGQPYLKSYADFNDVPNQSWEITEPAIYYQAGYIRLLSSVMALDAGNTTSIPNLTASELDIKIYPNPTNNFFVLQGDLWLYDIDILDSSGQIVQSIVSNNVEEIIDTSALGPGLYFLKVEHKTRDWLNVQKIIKE